MNAPTPTIREVLEPFAAIGRWLNADWQDASTDWPGSVSECENAPPMPTVADLRRARTFLESIPADGGTVKALDIEAAAARILDKVPHGYGMTRVEARTYAAAVLSCLPTPSDTAEAMGAPVARLDGVDEYGPRLSWFKDWADIGVSTLLYARPAPEAQDKVERLTRELTEAKDEIDRLTDENSDLRGEPWPNWATAVLKVIRKRSGYDGYDDTSEGVDLPAELDECMDELEGAEEHQRTRAETAEAALAETRERLEKECKRLRTALRRIKERRPQGALSDAHDLCDIAAAALTGDAQEASR